MPSLFFPRRSVQKPMLGAGVDWSNGLSRGLLTGYFMLEGGGATLYDTVGRKNASMSNLAWAAGRNGISPSFNGTTSAGTAIGPAFGAAGTIALWVYPTFDVTVAAQRYCFDSTSTARFLFGHNSSANSWFWYVNGLGITDNATDVPGLCPVNVWTHIGLVWTGTQATIYKNGVQAFTSAKTTTAGTPTTFYIGERSTAVSFWQGGLDQLLTWTRALSAAEIQHLSLQPTSLLQPQRPVFVSLPSVVISTLNPGADALTISDSPLFDLTYLITESPTLSDSPVLGVSPIATDGLTLADLAPTIWPALALRDPLTLSEAAVVALGLTPSPNGLTLAEVLVAAHGQNGSDALALAESAQTALGPTLADALALADVLATAQAGSRTDSLTLADAWTLGGWLSALVDPVPLLDAPQNQPGFMGLWMFGGAYNALFAQSPALADPLRLAEAVQSALSPTLTDALALIDALNAAQSGQLTLADSLTLSDVVVTGLLARFTDPLTLSEVLLASGLVQAIDGLSLADALAIIAQVTANNIIAIDGLTLTEVGATAQRGTFSDPLTLIEVIASGLRPSLSDALTLAEALTTALRPILVDPLTLSDAIMAAGLVRAVDGLTLAEAWAIVNAATNFLNATDTLAPVDSFSTAVGLLTADPLLLADLIRHTLRPSLSDALALVEALNAVGAGQLALTDTLSVSDAAAVTLLAAFNDPLILAEALIAAGLVSALDGLTVSEAWSISVSLGATDSLSLSETLSAQTRITDLIAAIRRHFVVPNRAFHFAVPVRQTHFVVPVRQTHFAVPQRSFHFIVSSTPYALPVTPGDSDNTIGSTENLLSYDVDFGLWLLEGEGIDTCRVTCSAVLRSNPTFDMSANAVAFVLSSAISGSKVVGTVDPHNALIGARYTLLFSATTSLGRTLTKPLQPLDCDR